MTESIWNVPSEWKVEGGGGGGTGETVSWGDIQNKPSEFKPRPHTHKITDIETLEESLSNKVDKEQGKGLSQEDFTTELKKKLDNLPSEIADEIVSSINGKTGDVIITKEDIGLENVLNIKQASEEDLLLLKVTVEKIQEDLENIPDLPESYVESVNGLTGEVKIDKDTVGLSNLTNEKQATQAELDFIVSGLENLIEANKKYAESYTDEKIKSEIDIYDEKQKDALNSKVDKVVGKGLSTNDFTNEYRFKVDSLPEKNNIVQTVNNVSPVLGNVQVDKQMIGLGELENIKYAPLHEFDTHLGDSDKHLTPFQKSQLEHLDEELASKVDKVEGKSLSSNDFTDEEKLKLSKIPEEFEGSVVSVNNISPDEEGNIQITKADMGLSNVVNEEQATKTEFDAAMGRLSSAEETVSLHTKNISEIEDKLENLDFPESPVLSVNGKTGNVVVTKETIGLSNVSNVEQVAKEDFEGFKEQSGVALIELTQTMEGYTDKEVASEANRTNSKLLEKVDKELGKSLTSNDFTNEYKNKLDSIDTTKQYVQTINNSKPDKQGNVIIDKETVGLDKLENISYVPQEDFDYYKTLNQENLEKKVDKVDGKDLSSNDFTNEDKLKLDNIPTDIDTGVMSINSQKPDETGDIKLDYASITELNEHKNNTNIHLSEQQTVLIDSIPNKVDKDPNKGLSTNDFTDEYQTLISQNANEIEALRETNLKSIVISVSEPNDEDKYEGLIWYQIEQ